MFNRTLVIAAALIVAVAAIVIMLTRPAFGPRESQAGYEATTISIEQLHREVDHGKLPVHTAPEP